MLSMNTGTLRRVILAALVLLTALAAPALADSDGTATYRALLIGNSVYAADEDVLPDLPSCKNDLTAMYFALQSGSIRYDRVTALSNKSAQGIASAVNSVALWGADDDDVTVFYYTGHGYLNGLVGVNYSETDGDGYSFSLLQSALGNVPGKVIVLLDSCYSGALVGKGARSAGSFAQNAVAAFSGTGVSGLTSKAINSGSKFHVIASSSQNEESWAVSDAYGLATDALTSAMGWQHGGSKSSGNRLETLEGDGNRDGTVTVGEAYAFASEAVEKYQEMQIYPVGSTQALIARDASDDGNDDWLPKAAGTMNLARACIAPGRTLQLTCDSDSAYWTSSNTAVATVDSATGMVTGIRASTSGVATIMATYISGGKSYSASCDVRVLSSRYVVLRLRLKKSSLTLEQARSYAMGTSFTPYSAKYKTLRWKSSDTSVATVSSKGVITAVAKSGTATITATATSGVTAQCVVTATGALPRSIKLDKSKLTLIGGQKYMLAETISPSYAENQIVTWTSSRPSIATVNQDGQVSANTTGKTGRTLITAKTINGKKAYCYAYVVKNQSIPRTRPRSAAGKLVNSARRIYYTSTGSLRVDLWFYNRTRYTQTVPPTAEGLIVLELKDGTKVYDTVTFLTRKNVRSGRYLVYTVDLNLEDYPKFAGLNLLGSDAEYGAVN